MRIPRAVLAALALAFFVNAAGCGKSPEGPSGAAAATLLYARGADSEKLDPHSIEDGESVKICNNLYEGLVTYAWDSAEVVPSLAEKWEHSADGLTWTFHLRSGVRFHDGTACDAAAVAFNFDRILHPDGERGYGAVMPYAPMYKGIVKVEAAGAGEVVFTLAAPSAVFLPNLAMFPATMISPAALQNHKAEIAQNPVGTGPYRFVRWDRNDRIILEANAAYWGDKPKTSKVIFLCVPDNSVRLRMLRNREAHVADGLNLHDAAGLAKDAAVRLLKVPGMNFGYLAMNTRHKPLDDPRVRRAVAYAVDKKALIKVALDGQGETGPNPLPPTVWGYAKDLADYPHDLERARAQLAEAGVALPLKLTLWWMPNPRPYMPEPKKVGQVLQEQLKKAGIEVELVSYEWITYRKKLEQGEHDLALMGWITDNGDPDNFLYALLHSDNAKGASPLNITFYGAPDVDRVLVAAQSELDPAKRLGLYHDAQKRLHEDVPMLPLVYLPEMAAARSDVSGYMPHPVGLVRVWKAEIQAAPAGAGN